jgi:hypothetical protein
MEAKKKKHIHRWKNKDECCFIAGCYTAECRCKAVGHFDRKGKLQDIAI